MGDPAGIGPEIIVKSMASPDIEGLAIFILFGDKKLFEKLFFQIHPDRFNLHSCQDLSEILDEPGVINIIDPGPVLEDCVLGKPSVASSQKAFKCLETAVKLMLDEKKKTDRGEDHSVYDDKLAQGEKC